MFFLDSLYDERSTAVDHNLEGTEGTSVTRKLNDGREFQIVKVFYEPAALEARLTALGFAASVKSTDRYFLYGSAELSG